MLDVNYCIKGQSPRDMDPKEYCYANVNLKYKAMLLRLNNKYVAKNILN